MVISLSRALDADGRQVGVTAEFKKDRAAIVDPHRKLTFSLDRENGGYLLSPECDVVGTCFEAITDVLFKAHQNGRGSLGRQALSDEVYTAHGYAQKTVDNTVGAMVQKREIVKPARGRVALAPATLQRLTYNRDLSLEGSNKERTQSETTVLPVPDAVPAALNGNCCSSQGTTPGTSENLVIASNQQEFLPVMQTLPYQMEDGDYEF